MASERMIEKINEQIQKELYSEYLYLSMQAYFAAENLDGFANFFKVQTQEERFHANKFFDYVNQVGGRVILRPIAGPKTDFASPEEIFQLALAHEKLVTRSIYDLVDIALEERDHTAHAFLQWFITEQAEEEATMDGILKKLKLIANDGRGLLMLDAELATRVFTPPAVGA